MQSDYYLEENAEDEPAVAVLGESAHHYLLYNIITTMEGVWKESKG